MCYKVFGWCKWSKLLCFFFVLFGLIALTEESEQQKAAFPHIVIADPRPLAGFRGGFFGGGAVIFEKSGEFNKHPEIFILFVLN